jgi:hypothetical protein
MSLEKKMPGNVPGMSSVLLPPADLPLPRDRHLGPGRFS